MIVKIFYFFIPKNLDISLFENKERFRMNLQTIMTTATILRIGKIVNCKSSISGSKCSLSPPLLYAAFLLKYTNINGST